MGFIILTGPKHSGKTSAGKELARLMGLPFIDLDLLIAEQTGKSPRELYTQGAEFFRRAETAALKTALSPLRGPAAPEGRYSGILAAGGGIIDNPAALELLEPHRKTTVYLDIPADSAWERISRGELPPFLQGENPQEQHRILHTRRAEGYRAFAALNVGAEGKTPDCIAKEIRILLEN
jgi:shikimate kinase